MLEVEGAATPLDEGDALFVPAGAEHRFTAYEHLVLARRSSTARTPADRRFTMPGLPGTEHSWSFVAVIPLSGRNRSQDAARTTTTFDIHQLYTTPDVEDTMPTKSMTFKRARTPHYDDPAAVGRRVYEAREAAGLSQRELAFPGCSAAYISRIERGERVPSLQVMRELARRTGVTEEQLAFGREKLDPTVAERVRAAEAAESNGNKAERASAYKALARAATKAARAAGGEPDPLAAASVGSGRMTRDADIVVVGAGITGAATARALAQAGRGVLLVEQFEPGHDHGSSHGDVAHLPALVSGSALRPTRAGRPAELARARGGMRRAADRADRGARLRARRARERPRARSMRRAPRAADDAQVRARWPIAAEPGEPILFHPDAGIMLAGRAWDVLVAGAVDGGALLLDEPPRHRDRSRSAARCG